MMEMQNGIKHLQMEQWLMENAWMVIMVQFQELVLNLVQMAIGAQFLVHVMVCFPSYFESQSLLFDPKTNKWIDVDECLTNNGGCHDQAICANTPGSFTCACKEGYLGNGFTCTGTFLVSFPFALKLFVSFEINLIQKAIICEATSIGNANYSITLAGNIALGKCDELYGNPTLYCNLTGYWNQTITGNPCSSTFLDFLFFFFYIKQWNQ